MVKKEAQNFVRIVQGITIDRLFEFSRKFESKIDIDKSYTETPSISEKWTSTIEVNSSHSRIEFTTFYSIPAVLCLTTNRPKGRDEQYCLSFMNEYCNVIGGAITRILQQGGSDSKISLPEHCEMANQPEIKENKFKNREIAWWHMRVDGESFIVRLVLDYAEGFNFNEIEVIEEPDNILEFF